MLLVLTMPVFGKVRRVTPRVIQDIEDVITTRKANFGPGDILGTPLVQLTIVNDPTPAFLLLELRMDLGGTWNGQWASVKLVRKIAGGETLTFTNKDAISFLDNFREGASSDNLTTVIGISTIEDITNLTSLPEGVYKISLSAYEIELADENDIKSTITKQSSKMDTAEVSFNVVTIGAITSVQNPTVDNLHLSFQLPQIPYYSDTSIPTASSTTITITGDGVSQSLTQNHARVVKSFDSQIKGYPGGLTDGYVDFDLSNVSFRAGETYDVEITFTDSFGYLIANRTVSFTFPTPKLNTAIDTTNPYLPEFSWSYSGTDYSDWTKEYRIYLNGSYVGYTTTDSYTATSLLTPSTNYTWYVMPVHKDKSTTPFFSSSSALTKSFTTKAHTELDVEIDSPMNNAVLLTNKTYAFDSLVTFSDDATVKSAVWKIGTENKNGSSTTYTPTKRYTSNSLLAYLNVVDSFNLSKNSNNLYLTVLDPAIGMSGGTRRTVNKDSQTTLSIDTQATRDLESVEWFINGSNVGYGNQINYTFSESGNYTVYAQGTSKTDMQGDTRTVKTPTTQITVVGEGPTVAIIQPSATVEMVLGSNLILLSQTDHENALLSTTWTMSGAESGQIGTSPSQTTFTPKKEGEYQITFTAVDIHQKSASASLRIMVIDPKITITNPAPNTTFPLSATLIPTISAPNAERITYFIQNNEISSSSYDLSSLGTGTFSLYARAFWDVVNQQGQRIEFSKDTAKISFIVKDLVPPKVDITFPENDMLLKTGVAYTLKAEVQSSSSLKESWWEVDGVKLTSNAYTPPNASSKKLITIAYNAVNSDGVKGTKTITVRLANPSVYLTPPSDTSFLIGSVIPISASTVDAELFYLVDDVEIEGWDKTFNTSGPHSLRAGWRMEAIDANGNLRTYTGLSSTVNLTGYTDEAPLIKSTVPSLSTIHQVSGVPVIFSVSASSDNTMVPTKWTILKDDASIRETEAASISHASWGPGLYTVRAQVGDIYGYTATHEWAVKILNPQATITYPEAGMRFAKGQVPAVSVHTNDVSSYTLSLNGQPISADFNWSSLSVGAYTVSVNGLYAITGKADLQKTPTQSVSFAVEDRTPPSFQAEGFRDGDRVIAGLTYNLIVSRSGNESLQWFKNGSLSASGTTYSFTPSASEKTIALKIRGTLNGLTVDQLYTLTVIDPYISIVIPKNLSYNNLYAPNTPIPLQFEARDIDRVEWRVDMKKHTGQSVSLSPGMHSIDVDGYATNVRLADGTIGDYLPVNTSGITGKDIQVAELHRVWDINMPDKIASGQNLDLTVSTSSDPSFGELIASLSYTVDGKVYKEEKMPLTKQATITNLTLGSHVIGVTSTDVFGNTYSVEKPVIVHAPLVLAIQQPSEGERISPDSNILASLDIVSGSWNLITWRVGNKPVPNSNFTTGSLGKLLPGKHTITASARDELGNIVSTSVNVEVQSDFQLNLIQPSDSVQVFLENPVVCMVGLEKVNGSSINLSEAAKHITWFVNGVDTGQSGLTYLFFADKIGNFTIMGRYANNGMIRTTGERTINVRDIALPVINKPLNGEQITYSLGKPIPLSSTGESGATYTWMLNDKVIAMGRETFFNPNGLTGQQQIKLITSAWNRSKEKLVTVHLQLNTFPNLDLTMPPVQYTGETLKWTATAFDVEDKNPNPLIEYFLDGVPLTESPKVLSPADLGNHTLLARTIDSMGSVSTKQAVFTVESSQIPLVIQSPVQGETYFTQYAIPLIATLGEGGGKSIKNGLYTWTVHYLDDPSQAKETFSSSTASFTSKALGDVEITSTFHDENKKERAREKILIQVKNEPLKLAINWIHGNVVNARQSLTPQLIGLTKGSAEGTLSWSLNGNPVESMQNFTAPEAPGNYTLVAQYTTADTNDKAEVSFTVNGLPTVFLTSPMQGKAYKRGEPLILSANIDDDQHFGGTVVWTDEKGTILGEGNPFILVDPQFEINTITATAIDGFGGKGSASAQIQFYNPITDVSCSVNNELPTYLVNQSTPPLAVKASFNGGFKPQVTWRLKQGDRLLEKTGKENVFLYGDLSLFLRDQAVMTVIVSDASLVEGSLMEVYRKDYPILFTSDATATLISPVAKEILRVGEPVSLQVALTGFTKPVFALNLNGNAIDSNWELGENTKVYRSTIDSTFFANEGVYELALSVRENGITRNLMSSLNLYQMRTGVFVDNVPETFDMNGASIQLQATTSGLEGIDNFAWKTDLSADPVGFESSLDLQSAKLQPGDRSITVEAKAGSQVIDTYTFLLKVIGNMSLRLSSEEERIIVQRGADTTLEATAIDRDGNVLGDDAITWTSHLDGLIASSRILSFKQLPDLSKGEHIFTVTASGSNGGTISQLIPVQINTIETNEQPSDLKNEETSQDDEGQTPPDQYGGPPQDTFMGFDQGAPIDNTPPPYFPDPFGPGPGGAPMYPGLGSYMDGFFGGMGGGMGGGYGGMGGGGMPGFGF